MANWLEIIQSSASLRSLVCAAEGGGAVSARGAAGSSTAIVAAALARSLSRMILIVVAHLDEADEMLDELESLGLKAARLPALEVLPGESSLSLELLAERLGLVRRVRNGEAFDIIIAPIQALMQTVPAAESLGGMLRVLHAGDSIDHAELTRWLDEVGYRRVETIESPGEFSVRGGIIDLFPAGGEPCRIDLFGDDVEGIYAIDLDTMGSDRRLEELQIVGATMKQLQRDEGLTSFVRSLPGGAVAILADVLELTEQGRSYFDRVTDASGVLGPPAVFSGLHQHCQTVFEINQFNAGTSTDACIELPAEPLPMLDESVANAVRELADLGVDHEVVICCQNEGELQRMRELQAEHAPGARFQTEQRFLHRGFIWRNDEQAALALVPYHELLHRYETRRRIRRIAAGRAIDAFVDLQPGDYVVHRDHGIGKYLGLRHLDEGGGSADEYLVLEFARSGKLNVPVTRIELVQKYIGAFSGSPQLSTLGGRKWTREKEKVSEAVRDLAAEMLRLQAAREAMPGIRYPADTVWQHEFEAEFPYDETEDQLAAIGAVKRDMTNERPMDRLICGDVGFGKTEIAIRAAFKTAEYGKQVAVLVPTTVLAEQHERTFRGRFADYPFRIESISRFRTTREQKEIIEDLKRGRVDIIIGTHRLLSKDVKFADLGLVIIDEEQRFGVEHKQRLLEYRATCDVLTLSATPIPRTLHMSLLGLRDISSLSTPPLDRRAIVTEVIPPNAKRIKQAIARELAREGQVFYVHNRVYNIESVADEVSKLAPDARILIGHGQMPSRELEKVMLDFIRVKADILVCTTIIESGIDIPTANTMIVNDAHMFGLAELHQLRGRVGRSKHRAYCYLLLPNDGTITETAMKRLQALESFSMLGAGFKIALRDLELRGAGNLLGPEQSGHIAAVGYEMYCQLLDDAVAELRNEERTNVIDTSIDLGIFGALPKGYIPSDARRLDAYRRISRAGDEEAIEQIRTDLVSAYGDLPQRAERLFEIALIRILAAQIGVRSITRHEADIILRTAQPRELEARLRGIRGSVRIVGDADDENLTSIYYRPPDSYREPSSLLAVLRKRLKETPEAESIQTTEAPIHR